ncbi:hypothetical protein [Rhodococcus sp. IEGM 1379]|uniref:hypothetical protein n=1 Tax=Rhodococcus sp. IEGM 1379 TaxID=3047086 RepID=UPI0024B6A0F1|nr:hypothetical protein [Rhodococcus sp. IEGM 1379]MDI9918482.1 hypothetical protein [Rhodococcus sp. IEGM 1379]
MTSPAWSEDQIRDLSDGGGRFGINLDADSRTSAFGTSSAGTGGDALGRRSEPSLLFADLRRVHRIAAEGLSGWE